MGWTTNDEDVKVISRETIEDTNPKLYKKRAKEFVKIGDYKEAEKEYDKAIEYSGKQLTYYLSKLLFYIFDSGEYGKAVGFLFIIIWVKASFLYWFALGMLLTMLSNYRLEMIFWIFALCAVVDFGIRAAAILHKITNGTWLKYFIRVAVAVFVINLGEIFISAIQWRVPEFLEIILSLFIGLFMIFAVIYILSTVIEFIREIFKHYSAKKHQEEEHLFETAFGDSESSEKKSVNTFVPDNMQQHSKQEQNQANKVFQQDILPIHQEALQKEKYSAVVDEGMLLVLDVPIQKNNIFLDKVIIKKNMVKLPIKGENMQIDVSCKKFETISTIDFEQCKRYDIKKGSLVYILVAMIEYCANIWSREWDENTESACEKLTVQLNQKLNPYGIRTRLSKRGWQFLENNVLISFEDVIFLLNNKTA